MKGAVRNIILIELLMLLVIISTFFEQFLFDHYRYLIFLFISGIISYFVVGMDINRMPNSKTIFKNTIIILLMYFLISYFLGLFVGFAKTIYSWSFVNLVKNIIPRISVIMVAELLRYHFIKKSDYDKKVIVLSFLIFTLLDISIGLYNYDLSIKDELYEFIGLISIGSVSKNILMTVYDIKGDYFNSIMYRLIMELYIFIIPIVPNYGVYIDSVILTIIPILLSFITINLRNRIIQKPSFKKKSTLAFFVVLFILSFLVLLNSGFFKYQTLVIGSNSMRKLITKGDVIILEKLNEKQKNELEVGDIIVFRYEGKLIAHRLHEIKKINGERYYITKGDNNNAPDGAISSNKNVLGVTRLKIPVVGLPSVWLSELFQ